MSTLSTNRKMSGMVLWLMGAALGTAHAATTLVVARGEDRNIASSATYEGEEIHGTLRIVNTAGTKTIEVANATAGAVCSLGTNAGDRAQLVIGKYGRVWGGVFTVGGPDGNGTITVSGSRPGGRTELYDDGAYSHLAIGGLDLAANASNDAGVIDVLQLGSQAAAGLIADAHRQRLVNASPSADMRLCFNGGYFAVFNAVAATNLFTTVSNELFPADVPQGKGGRAIVLEGLNGNAVDFRLAGGVTCRPCCGTVNFRGAGNVKLYAKGAGEREPYGWLWDQPASSWQQNGNLVLDGCFRMVCEADDVLPSAASNGIVRVLNSSLLDLNGRAQALNGLEVVDAACLTNSSPDSCSLTFRTNSTLVVSHVGGEGLITAILKGAGTLCVSETPSFPAFNIQKGTLRVTGDCRVRRLELSKGVRLIVDGGTLAVTEFLSDGGATFESENGGCLSVTQNCETDRNLALGANTAYSSFTKTGTGRLTLYATGAIDVGVHVAAGTLGFAVPGTSNRWFRFSFKRMYGDSAFQLSEMLLMDKDSKRVDVGTWQGETYAMTDAAAAYALQKMPEPSIWAADQGWVLSESDSYRRTRAPSALFDGNAKTLLRYATSVTPSDSSTWKTFVVRIPACAPDAYCYNFRNGYCGVDHPTDWSLETSPDGVCWSMADEQIGQVAKSSGSKQYYNDGVHYGIYAGQSGATGLAAGVDVRVDRGAVFDASGVTGKQTLDRLTLDCSGGSGVATFRNVRLAATGTLNLLGSPSSLLPCVFEDSELAGTLDGWTVCSNGRPMTSYHLSWSQGRLFVMGAATVIRLR